MKITCQLAKDNCPTSSPTPWRFNLSYINIPSSNFHPTEQYLWQPSVVGEQVLAYKAVLKPDNNAFPILEGHTRYCGSHIFGETGNISKVHWIFVNLIYLLLCCELA